MVQNFKEILEEAKKHKYAIPQFNINNLEWTRFILEECNKNNSPVILGVSEGAIKYMGGCKTIVDMINNLIAYLSIKIPVCIHLDHGSNFDICKEAIDSGFTSVMIDASKKQLDESIALTKKVVTYSKNYNVTVEGEVGIVGNCDNNTNSCAKVSDCVRYCKQTGIDFLAPAVGSVHGLYKGDPNLNFELIKEIQEQVKIPLVLHGGTGIYDNQIKKCIENGICKININTELQVSWANAVKENIKINENVYDPRKIIKFGEEALKKSVSDKILLFNSRNKA